MRGPSTSAQRSVAVSISVGITMPPYPDRTPLSLSRLAGCSQR